MREIQSTDPTWSADVKLVDPNVDAILAALEAVLNEASQAGFLHWEETLGFFPWMIAMSAALADAETPPRKYEIGRITLRISFARHWWWKVGWHNRTKSLVYITASPK